MKTKIEKKTGIIILRRLTTKRLILAALIAISIAFTACDDKCSCTTGTTHEPNENCCKGTDCNCSIAEPAVKDFQINLNLNGDYNADVKDGRTNAGSKTLAQLGVVQQIEDAINEAFDTAGVATKARFISIFQGNATISVDNPATYYAGANVTGKYTMNFHINYLTSNPSDLQDQITAAINTMDAMVANSRIIGRDTIRMAKAPADTKTFAKQVVAQIPQSRAAIQQRT